MNNQQQEQQGEIVTDNTQEEVVERGLRKDFKQLFTAKNMARIGILSALSYVLYMFVKFPLAVIFPAWLDIQFSDIPALLGSFAINPYAGGLVIIIKCLLKMPFTSSACVGELVDILIGLSFVMPAGFIYRRYKTKKGAIFSMMIGALISTAVAILSNRLFIVPFYVQVTFGGNWDVLLGAVSTLYPHATRSTFYNYYLWLACLPFNLIRLSIVSLITILIYKPLRRILHD